MLRLGLWRALYHALCLLKRLGFRGGRVRYFAYGANLDPAVLARRTIVPLARNEAALPDHRLAFNHSVPFRGAAMASVDPAPGESVPGVIYELWRIDALRLDCLESRFLLGRYGKEAFRHGKLGPVFFYRSRRRVEGLAPSRAYLDKILAGYGTMTTVSADFKEKLARTMTLPGFEPKHPPEFLLRNYDILGKWGRKWLVAYDERCVARFSAWIFKPSRFEK